jgi:hypothetical protein
VEFIGVGEDIGEEESGEREDAGLLLSVQVEEIQDMPASRRLIWLNWGQNLAWWPLILWILTESINLKDSRQNKSIRFDQRTC